MSSSKDSITAELWELTGRDVVNYYFLSGCLHQPGIEFLGVSKVTDCQSHCVRIYL